MPISCNAAPVDTGFDWLLLAMRADHSSVHADVVLQVLMCLWSCPPLWCVVSKVLASLQWLRYVVMRQTSGCTATMQVHTVSPCSEAAARLPC